MRDFCENKPIFQETKTEKWQNKQNDILKTTRYSFTATNDIEKSENRNISDAFQNKQKAHFQENLKKSEQIRKHGWKSLYIKLSFQLITV